MVTRHKGKHVWSKDSGMTKKALKKHEEKVTRFEAAIDKALEGGTEEAYAELDKLSAKVNNTAGDDDDS
ncbi:hypothetical protein LCGC14_2621510 [marine sediment metagenome]|uniref:Uncharacterized protein n=1 Tax=marine sediment metagenome TaxID=412755 RepID=A0A0F9AQJ5_9ZZZZ